MHTPPLQHQILSTCITKRPSPINFPDILHEQDVRIGIQGGKSIRIPLPHLFKCRLRRIKVPWRKSCSTAGTMKLTENVEKMQTGKPTPWRYASSTPSKEPTSCCRSRSPAAKWHMTTPERCHAAWRTRSLRFHCLADQKHPSVTNGFSQVPKWVQTHGKAIKWDGI